MKKNHEEIYLKFHLKNSHSLPSILAGLKLVDHVADGLEKIGGEDNDFGVGGDVLAYRVEGGVHELLPVHLNSETFNFELRIPVIVSTI